MFKFHVRYIYITGGIYIYMNVCSLCDEPYYAHGLCGKHYRIKNREKRNKTTREWKQNNLAHTRERDNRYYQTNKEIIKIKNKIIYDNNIEKFRKYRREQARRLRALNPEKYKKAVNKYKRKNAEKILVQQKEYVKKTGVTKFALKTWSTVIKTLDNNMCKLCDSKKYLNSHHIMPMQYYPELALDVNNGITLCEECHHKLHGFAIY